MSDKIHEESGQHQEKLSPEQFADNLVNKEISFTILHDSNIFRLNLRVKAMIERGYNLSTNIVSHPITYTDTINGVETEKTTHHLCVGLINPDTVKSARSRNYEQYINQDLGE